MTTQELLEQRRQAGRDAFRLHVTATHHESVGGLSTPEPGDADWWQRTAWGAALSAQKES